MSHGRAATQSVRWDDLKGRIDLVRVAGSLLGEPPGRGGERGRRSWWRCPFHDDRNPSFAVDPERQAWKCFGCGERGDAVSLVMKLRHVEFKEAVSILAGVSNLPAPRPIVKTPTPKPEPVVDPDALTLDEAFAIVEQSAERLWTDVGAEALSYLRSRGLTDETVRQFRLGWTPRLNRVAWSPQGVTIPWFSGERLTIVKVRCDQSFVEQFPEHRRPPRYLEAYRSPFAGDRDDAPVLGLDGIEPGFPVVVVEGEIDCLLLAQELAGLASVVTLGGAANRPGSTALAGVAACWPCYSGQDSDDAGDRAATAWPASFRRVRPPGPHKDWSDAFAGRVNLRRWWSDVFNGIERPALYTWDELITLPWPGSSEPPEPGIVIDRPPGRAELLATLEQAFAVA